MKFIQPIIFIVAFLIVTTILIFLNSFYTNIFDLDFSSVTSQSPAVDLTSAKISQSDSLKNDLQAMTVDSTLTDTLSSSIDSAAGNRVNAGTLSKVGNTVTQTAQNPVNDTLGSFRSLKPKQGELKAGGITEIAGANGTPSPDSSYIKWVKATAAMYESMDAKKAARIIQNYSDNIARDIIYKMKKKKAAEILAELDPAAATRIARYGG